MHLNRACTKSSSRIMRVAIITQTLKRNYKNTIALIRLKSCDSLNAMRAQIGLLRFIYTRLHLEKKSHLLINQSCLVLTIRQGLFSSWTNLLHLLLFPVSLNSLSNTTFTCTCKSMFSFSQTITITPSVSLAFSLPVECLHKLFLQTISSFSHHMTEVSSFW